MYGPVWFSIRSLCPSLSQSLVSSRLSSPLSSLLFSLLAVKDLAAGPEADATTTAGQRIAGLELRQLQENFQ